MKAIYILKSIVVVTCLLIATTVGATTIYVAGSGMDTNPGTQAAPVRTLAKALDLAVDGDEIGVMTNTTATNLTIAKSVKIFAVGGDRTLTATNNRMFTVEFPEGATNAQVVFKGLTFKNGLTADGEGGAINVINGKVHCSACTFEDNSAYAGGAIHAGGENSTLSLFDCEFYENKATGLTTEVEGKGGAIKISNGATFTAEYCIFENNTSNHRAGFLSLEGAASSRVYFASIRGNLSVNKGDVGAGAIYTGGESGGEYIFQSCSLIDNMGWGMHGGLAILDAADATVSFINCTIARNQNGKRDLVDFPESGGYSDGGTGCIWMLAGTLEFTNVTMIKNTTGVGNNGGNGSGITVQNAGLSLYINNSIIVGNVAFDEGGNANGVCDIVVRNTMTAFEIHNSVVGFVHNGMDGGTAWTIDADVPAVMTNSILQEYDYAVGLSSWSDMDESGLYTDDISISEGRFKMGYYPMKSTTEKGVSLGSAELLAAKEELTDLFLAERIAVGGKIWAGAVQGPIDMGAEAVEPTVPEDLNAGDDWYHSSIFTPSVGKLGVSSLVNGVLTINFGSLAGNAQGDLYTVNGQLIQKVFNGTVAGEGSYPINVAPGFYILKTTIDGNVFANQIIVK